MAYTHQKDFLEDMKPFYGLQKQTIIFLIWILYRYLKNIQTNAILKDQ